ncbi:ABC transporter substrate-binding protein [Nocardioides houyundeii]|uniref:ABC transporter substrate-binding protein n=1 Tax=Nocardioides houyundeii TaxID=2045452 RepID=UPI000DF45F63|nr:ABC transporter substrate-binding protein [Nocardioides houyundeii]
MSRARPTRAAVLLAVGLFAATACTAAPEGDGSSSEGGVKTGNGVTEDTITLLSLNDLSGPAAAGGKPIQAGFDAYLEQVNADGGIGGRQVVVKTVDTQYDPQKAVQLYQGNRDEIAALLSYGTPTTDAIRAFTSDDQVLALGLKGPFPEKNSFSMATAVEVDTANLLTHVLEEDPDARIGAILQADAMGEAVKRGVDAVSDAVGLELVAETSADSTSQELTAQVTAMRKAGADHILLGMGPGGLLATAGAVSSLKYDAQILSPGVAYTKSLMELPIAATLEKQLLSTCSYPLWDQESEGNTEFKEALDPSLPPHGSYVNGWLAAKVLLTFVENAIEQGDATPAGIIEAAQGSTVDTLGLTPNMTFGESIDERTAYRQTQLCTVSNDADDGFTLSAGWFDSEAGNAVKLQ